MKSKLLLCVGGLAVVALILIAASPEKKSDPAEATRLNNLGCAYMNQQLFEKALKYFEDAATADPNLRVAKTNQGIALLSLARVDESKKVLDEAAKENSKDPHIWYALGMLEKNSSDPQAAVDDFKHVIQIDDSDADTWYFLGTVYAQLKQFPQAIDAFDHALKLNPLHASAQFGLSRAYQQSGNTPAAREHLTRFQYITQHKLGSAMSLAYGDQGKYSLAEESPAVAQKVPPQIPVRFVDVTKEAGLEQTGVIVYNGPPFPLHASGACFLDFDNDGRIDLLLTNNGRRGGLSLYRNLGNGKFEDVTSKAGLDPNMHALSCTVGDYDNDGFADIALGDWDRPLLFHNEKNGGFKDVTKEAGITRGLSPRSGGDVLGLNFVDYDHDGDLDLYISGQTELSDGLVGTNETWRNNGNGTFSDVSEATGLGVAGTSTIGTDYNNDRAVDLIVTAALPLAFQNPREGAFSPQNIFSENPESQEKPPSAHNATAVAVLDFDHDGWMDVAFTYGSPPGIMLWHNLHDGKPFERVKLPETNWTRAFGIAAFDYDNDGWVDLVAVGETKEGKGEIRLFRNLGPDGWKDVTTYVGLDKIQLKDPRAIITGDYDNDGATDLLITQNHGPAVLLKNEGGNKNNWLRLALKGLNDNKSAIGTKVEVFSDGIRQKYEIYGSNGYLGQNSPYLTVGLGQAKQADVVRMLWPTGVLQDEVEIPANQQKDILEIDRRGSSCPTLFVWNGKHYELVADILGAGVVGHWVAPGERNIARPTEWVKIDPSVIKENPEGAPSFPRSLREGGDVDFPESQNPRPVAQTATRTGHTVLSFRLMEPMEEVVYLDAVKLLAVDHPANEEVYPNEYFASNPPYPEFKVVTSSNAKPPAGAWDDKGNNLLPDLLAHKYVGNLDLLPFKGFTKPHSLILDLGEPYRGGPLHLLMHGEIEYFTATGMYAASQAGIEGIAPYVEALAGSGGTGVSPVQPGGDARLTNSKEEKWVRVLDDMGFPAGLPKTITVDLSNKLPQGTTRIRITTNLQIYWDNILIDRSEQHDNFKLREIPLTMANLEFHGYPRQIEDLPPGNVKYVYEQVSRTGPYARQAGEYTRYGDVRPLLSAFDDKLAVFGSGEEVALEFDPAKLPALPKGWTRDYFFMANGYEKDMDFYAADGNTVEPLPFRRMGTYPYADKSFPSDDEHLKYMLEFNTRFMSGSEPQGYSYRFAEGARR
ncbi:MAG TPA: FG-GAP-like repeat-containing protein [Terriglobales bacterium]|nr:FG-GAP-like repeat-containing protein [Terriglobales bacterium]